MAYKGGIPIVLASFDYPSKTVEFSTPFYPTGDFDQDAPVIARFFDGKKGKTRGITPVN